VLFVNRYKEYLEAKKQKIEMLKAVDDKLSECERFNKAHEVVCSIRTIITCHLPVYLMYTSCRWTYYGSQFAR